MGGTEAKVPLWMRGLKELDNTGICWVFVFIDNRKVDILRFDGIMARQLVAEYEINPVVKMRGYYVSLEDVTVHTNEILGRQRPLGNLEVTKVRMNRLEDACIGIKFRDTFVR